MFVDEHTYSQKLNIPVSALDLTWKHEVKKALIHTLHGILSNFK